MATRRNVREQLPSPAETILAEHPPMLSISRAAEITGVSRRTLNRYVDAGVLPATQVGPSRVVRIMTRDLVALFQPVPTVHQSRLPRRAA